MFFEHTIQQHTFEFWIGHSDKVKQQLIITKVRFIAVIYVHAWYHKCNCKRAFLSSELLLEAKLWSSSVCLPFCILLIATAGKKNKNGSILNVYFWNHIFCHPQNISFFCAISCNIWQQVIEMASSRYEPKGLLTKRLKSQQTTVVSSLRRENAYLRKTLAEMSRQHAEHNKLVEVNLIKHSCLSAIYQTKAN